MTKEQATEVLHELDGSLYETQQVALDMAIKIMKQQPSDDKVTITMDKGTLKYSGKGYVVYNKDWFRKHFATEVKIMTGYDGYIEQPTSDDYVSRKDVLEMFGYETAIYDLPPVTPTQKWIPVSERLPEEEIDVLICNANKEIAISRGSYSTEIENAFIWYTSGWRFGEVIAWQPLPKPYEGKRGGLNGSN